MTRRNFTLAVKKRRLAYATGKDGVIRCEGCGDQVRRGKYEFDHHLADWLGGKPTFENCRLLCKEKCHKSKSSTDKKLSAKSNRVQAKDQGLKAAPQKKIQSRPFSPTAKQKPKLDRLPQPPRRSIYEDA